MKYSDYDSKYGVHRRRCIDGSVTGSCCCVGYCSNEIHEGFLTKELRKEHNCVKNECRYYLSKKAKAVSTVCCSEPQVRTLRRRSDLFSGVSYNICKTNDRVEKKMNKKLN